MMIAYPSTLNLIAYVCNPLHKSGKVSDVFNQVTKYQVLQKSIPRGCPLKALRHTPRLDQANIDKLCQCLTAFSSLASAKTPICPTLA